MIKIICLNFLFLMALSYNSKAQNQKYIATAILKSSIIDFVHAIDTSIILVDFMEIKKSKRDEVFSKVSGLILSGGRDVHPSTYGRKDSLKICITHKKRDEVELFLLQNAMKDSLPVLGICRGHQILNAILGGDLIQDIPTQHLAKEKVIHRDPKEQEYVYHSINIDSTSALFQLYGSGQFEVNSFHHQAVKAPGEGMKIVAQAPDGLNEASEWAKGLQDRWIIGVQWHPERQYQKAPNHLELMADFIRQLKQ